MEVIWSDAAIHTVQESADYALDKFGPGQVRKLRERIRAAVRKVSTMPSSCPLEQNLLDMNPAYRYVTLYHNLELIFHEVDDNVCMIDLIWNTRRNPQTLQNILK